MGFQFHQIYAMADNHYLDLRVPEQNGMEWSKRTRTKEMYISLGTQPSTVYLDLLEFCK